MAVALSHALAVLFPDTPREAYQVQDDGIGPYIAYWNTATLGPQPTQAQLDAVTQAQVDAYYATKARTDAKAQAQRDGDPAIKLLLALLITTTQSLNTLRQELARLRADVRTALPTVPTRPPIPTQTLADARQAVRDAIDTV